MMLVHLLMRGVIRGIFSVCKRGRGEGRLEVVGRGKG